MRQEAWRAYLEMALGLTEASRKKAGKAVQRALGKGGATADQFQELAEELLKTSTANREAITKLIRSELDRALAHLGLATADEVAELNARVRQLESELEEAQASAADLLAGAPAVAVAVPVVAAEPFGEDAEVQITEPAATPAEEPGAAEQLATVTPIDQASTTVTQAQAPGKKAAKKTARKAAASPAPEAADTKVAKKTAAKKTARKAAASASAAAGPESGAGAPTAEGPAAGGAPTAEGPAAGGPAAEGGAAGIEGAVSGAADAARRPRKAPTKKATANRAPAKKAPPKKAPARKSAPGGSGGGPGA